jgi:hypothetical protein
MLASPARIEANRRNSQRSTGPKTTEGKERSRRNGLKHGMTGAGIVLAEEDLTEVEQRNEALQAELDPQSLLGKIMVRQMAMLSVRMERSGTQEEIAIALRVRHAPEDFDQARLDEVEQLFNLLGEEPPTCLRRLRNSPEGVERLVFAWRNLRANLTNATHPTWTAWHRERAENLTGFKIDEASGSRIGALSKAISGNFAGLGAQEGEGDEEARKTWARARMVERIDSEIAQLEAHYETLDFEMIELDRRESGDRALFDPSREATLARRYESEATRGFYKALKELRRAEAEEAARPERVATPDPEETCDPMASSWDRPSATPREPKPMADPGRPMSDEADSGSVRRLEVSSGHRNDDFQS